MNNLFSDILPNLNKDYLTVFLTIYANNLKATAIIIGLGLIHRYLPKGVIFINGFTIGFIMSAFVFFLGINDVLFYIIPHGIFEIPGLLLATSVGISLTTQSKSFKDRFVVLINAKKDLILIALLLFIAALIETSLILLIR